jgi:hypothetical protein
MKRSWDGKNVDLSLLTTYIGEFFKAKDFEAVKGEIPTGFQIFASGSPLFRMQGYICVTIEGNPNNFTVTIERSTEKKKGDTPRFMFIEQMLFGGYLTLRKLKSDEAWLKLEKELWKYVENSVLKLTNSGNPTTFH